MRSFVFVSVYLLTLFAFRGTASIADSLNIDSAAVILKEVEVSANLQHATAQGNTYIPTPKEKRMSNNGFFLLKHVGIPELNVQPLSGEVTTISGDKTSVFINFLPATTAEVNGMRTEDVRRIDVLYAPSDPRFGGALNVVNFIVQPYEYGGYTKINEQLTTVNCLSNLTSLYSKFAYKKWTFDLSSYSNNFSSHHDGISEYETYRLSNQDGEIDIFRNLRTKTSNVLHHDFPVTIRAVYSKDGFQISNTAGFDYINAPRRNNTGVIELKPIDNDALEYSKTRSRINRMAWWNGSYFFLLPNNFTLNVAPQFSYSNQSLNNDYNVGNPPVNDLINDVAENSYFSRIDFTGIKKSTIPTRLA